MLYVCVKREYGLACHSCAWNFGVEHTHHFTLNKYHNKLATICVYHDPSEDRDPDDSPNSTYCPYNEDLWQDDYSSGVSITTESIR